MIGKIRIPIVEDKISIRESRESEDIKILNDKIVTFMGNKQLTEISYSSYFPNQYTPACDTSSIKRPTKYVSMINAIHNGDNYCRVSIPKMKINKMMQIVSFEWKRRATGDIDYSIELKEYNKPVLNNEIIIPPIETSTQVIDTTTTAFSGTLQGEQREVKIVDGTTYIVKAGDCLCDIARRHNMKWTDLYNDNKDIIGNDPNLIYAGQVLKIRGTAKSTEEKINKVNNSNKLTLYKNEKGTIVSHDRSSKNYSGGGTGGGTR